MMKNQEAIVERLDNLDKKLSLDRIGIINPFESGAQNGSGAENSGPITI